MKILVLIFFSVIIGCPISVSALDQYGQNLEEKVDDLERDLRDERYNRQKAQEQADYDRSRRQKEAMENEERQKELKERQQAIQKSLKRQEDAMRRQEEARERQIRIEKRAREAKIKREKEEAEFKLLKDMAEKNPNSIHSKLYEIEVLRRSGEISNYQANSRKSYVLRGPGGGIGEKKGGGITLTEEITDPEMKAKGLKKGQTFVDE
jgi:DNA repair exonuclease SbcCD ATPase subunit